MIRIIFATLAVFGLILSGCGDRLTTAVISGDAETLRKLLDDGADPDEIISFKHPNFAGGRVVRRRLRELSRAQSLLPMWGSSPSGTWAASSAKMSHREFNRG